MVRNRVRHCRPAKFSDGVPLLEGCAGRSEGESDSSASYKYSKLEVINLFMINYVKLNMIIFTWQARFAIQTDNVRFMLIVDTQLHVTWMRTRNDLKNHWVNEDGEDDPDRARARPPTNVRSVQDWNHLCDHLIADLANIV